MYLSFVIARAPVLSCSSLCHGREAISTPSSATEMQINASARVSFENRSLTCTRRGRILKQIVDNRFNVVNNNISSVYGFFFRQSRFFRTPNSCTTTSDRPYSHVLSDLIVQIEIDISK